MVLSWGPAKIYWENGLTVFMCMKEIISLRSLVVSVQGIYFVRNIAGTMEIAMGRTMMTA